MRNRPHHLVWALVIAALLLSAVCYALLGRPVVIESHESVGRLPRVRPDYVGCVIPPNIAPLNFCVEEPGARYYVEISSQRGEAIKVASRTLRIVIPPRPWKRLLRENPGEELRFDVYVQGEDDVWRRFDTVTNTIADEGIDGYLVYRLISAGHNLWGDMGIYERNLGNYKQSLVLHNRSIRNGCMNCHTFFDHNTDRMILHFRRARKDYGNGMLLIENGAAAKVDTRTEFNPLSAAYASWHPGGRVLAFSMNKVRQFFHSARAEGRDVIDLESDLAIYLLDSNTVTSTAAISNPDRLETYPAWSADGRHLYFCSAPILWADRDAVPPERFAEVQYDLMRVGYDIGAGTWGDLETVLSAEETGANITHPRVSPDGRLLLFSMSEYSPFPIFQSNTDLYLMDLATGQYHRLACNSDQCDSWHCWSSNGRWIVFSSKRDNGLMARPYFSYIDESGSAHKPFVLPQRDPTFYDSFLCTYNVPELVRQPVPLKGEEIAAVIRSPDWVLCGPLVTAPTPRAGASPDREATKALPDPGARAPRTQ